MRKPFTFTDAGDTLAIGVRNFTSWHVVSVTRSGVGIEHVVHDCTTLAVINLLDSCTGPVTVVMEVTLMNNEAGEASASFAHGAAPPLQGCGP